jgi:hypothetical protein
VERVPKINIKSSPAIDCRELSIPETCSALLSGYESVLSACPSGSTHSLLSKNAILLFKTILKLSSFRQKCSLVHEATENFFIFGKNNFFLAYSICI